MCKYVQPTKFSVLAVLIFLFSVVGQAIAGNETLRVSGPHSFENLSIYLIHGSSVEGPVPLTLEEAMKNGSVRIHETGNVQKLSIENLSDKEVFIQAGDIVKGGKQDRVLTVTAILHPKSGRIAIGAYCVEAGRWAARGKESKALFASSTRSVASRKLKLALKNPAFDQALDSIPSHGRTQTVAPRQGRSGQQIVWQDVADAQKKLSKNVGEAVTAAHSPSSLQLTLENKKLQKVVAKYLGALEKNGRKHDDVVGYAFAINGKLNSADIYPSNGLFRKMWPKLLAASVTEAISEKHNLKAKTDIPTSDAVQTFVAQKSLQKPKTKKLMPGMELETSDAKSAYSFVTRHKDGRTLHLNLIAKH